MANHNYERVIVYVDGFNLYFGIREKFPRRYRWLDLNASAQKLLKSNQRLVDVRYFTARISKPLKKQERQERYLQALEAVGGCTLHFGAYRDRSRVCKSCGNILYTPEEKMTDVKIAVEMLADAYTDRFDTALLISGDTDIVPPIAKIHQLFSSKRIVVAFPPGRFNHELKQIADAHIYIRRSSLIQLPEQVQKSDGYTLSRPSTWR